MNSLLIIFIFIPILSIILLAVNIILAPHNPYEEKDSAFECGFHSFLGQNRTQFSVSFFLFGILFLVFDLEIVLIMPVGVTLYDIGNFGFTIFLIFFIILTIGFILDIGSGAIALTNFDQPSSNALAEPTK